MFRRLQVVSLLAAWITFVAGCAPTGGVVGASIDTGTGGTASSPASDGLCTIPTNSQQLGMEVFRLVNQLRRENGLTELTWNATLVEAGGNYACRMIQDDFFAHVDPVTGEGPGERAIKAGYAFLMLGENLAAGQPTPQAVIDAWMDSPSHRENILNPAWKELGVAVRLGGEYGVYWVQEFGDPLGGISGAAGDGLTWEQGE